MHLSSKLKGTKANTIDDIMETHDTLIGARGHVETEAPLSISDERRAGVARLLDEMSLPLVPLDVLLAVLDQPITPEEGELFKLIYEGTLSEWETFWDRPSVRGLPLEMEQVHRHRPRLRLATSAERSVRADGATPLSETVPTGSMPTGTPVEQKQTGTGGQKKND